MSRHRYFATCARGLEPVLADELRHLAAQDVIPGRGGVAFQGNRTLLYRANLCLRTAVRVLQPVLSAEVRTPDELYEAVRTHDWGDVLSADHTMAVDCNVRDSAITHSQYASRRVKDAICDQFRDRIGRRPNVDAERPMVGFNLHIDHNLAVLSLDSSGDSLHKRGYRPIQTIAPLNEALAAGLVLLTGWDGSAAFADALCGSGTLCIEASWIALNRPPGLTRKHFGFMGWPDFARGDFADVRGELRDRVRTKLEQPIVGSDERSDAITFAKGNARAAGVGHLLQWERRDVATWEPPAPAGTWLCNPPYGERIGEEKELRGLYKTIGEVIRTRCEGWQAWVFTGNSRLARFIGIKPITDIPLFNGRIPCRLLRYR